jgi:hypothetical protein
MAGRVCGGRRWVVAERKAFLLRIDPAVLEALQAWADDELRSLNGQIEFVLRDVLQQEGRLRTRSSTAKPPATLPRRRSTE